MGFEPVFGFVEATEWFAVEGVFMGGVLLGWAGKFSSAGPVRDAAHERNVEGGSFHGGRGKGLSDGEVAFFLFGRKQEFIIFFSGFPRPQTAIKSPVPAAPGAAWVVR